MRLEQKSPVIFIAGRGTVLMNWDKNHSASDKIGFRDNEISQIRRSGQCYCFLCGVHQWIVQLIPAITDFVLIL